MCFPSVRTSRIHKKWGKVDLMDVVVASSRTNFYLSSINFELFGKSMKNSSVYRGWDGTRVEMYMMNKANTTATKFAHTSYHHQQRRATSSVSFRQFRWQIYFGWGVFSLSIYSWMILPRHSMCTQPFDSIIHRENGDKVSVGQSKIRKKFLESNRDELPIESKRSRKSSYRAGFESDETLSISFLFLSMYVPRTEMRGRKPGEMRGKNYKVERTSLDFVSPHTPSFTQTSFLLGCIAKKKR